MTSTEMESEVIVAAFGDFLADLFKQECNIFVDEGTLRELAEKFTEFTRIWDENYDHNQEVIDYARKDLIEWAKRRL